MGLLRSKLMEMLALECSVLIKSNAAECSVTFVRFWKIFESRNSLNILDYNI